MTKSLIVAVTENGIIGKENGMPWHLPADLKYFRERTTGHHIIMGRKTFESIGGGRPLPNRVSIIVTNQADYKADGCLIAHSLYEAMAMVTNDSEMLVIGGRQMYEQALTLVDRLYITKIHASIDGDTSFPPIVAAEWRLTESTEREPDEKNKYKLTFQVFEKA